MRYMVKICVNHVASKSDFKTKCLAPLGLESPKLKYVKSKI